MKYFFLLCAALFFSCTKTAVETTIEPQKPTLIRIDAEHIDGEIVATPIILVR